MIFTPEQERAIDIARLGEDACIVAGPGSGKTTVLVERYRRLVASGMNPARLIAITFTEKAAANMRLKLAEKFAGSPEILSDLDRAHVSTIHAFCSRLLRDNAMSAGVDPEFTILDEQVAAIEQARALREALDELTAEKSHAMSVLLDATSGADLEALIPSIYDAMRAAGMRPEDLRHTALPIAPSLEPILAAMNRYALGGPANPNLAQRSATDSARTAAEKIKSARTAKELSCALKAADFNKRTTNSAKDEIDWIRAEIDHLVAWLLDDLRQAERSLLIEAFERFDARYRARKTALASLDFNDLEFFTVRLLEENPAVRQQINQQYLQVMIDEFQDTSAQQSRLVDLVRGVDRFYAVGDLNQSIYGFRHASPAVFRSYQDSVKSRNGHASELVENWRSRPPILRAVQTILHAAPGITDRDLIPANVFADRDHPSVEVMFFDRDEEDEDYYMLEAAWIASRIHDLLNTQSAKLGDIAILVRNSTILDPYLEALEKAGIDYNLNRRTGFLETREARDLMHLLRMIENPRDEESTLAVLRSGLAGISDEGLLRMKLHGNSFGRALADPASVQLDAEDRTRFDRFTAAFRLWRASARFVPVDRLILRALDEMGVVWNPLSPGGANIEKFLTIARARKDQTLAEFVDYLNTTRKADPREQDSPIDETRDAIQIMTSHAAKGLEFPVLFLAAMDKGMLGSESPMLNFTPALGLGLKWSDGPGLIHIRNAETIKAADNEESHRLLYVALTRAKERLILTWTQKPDGKAPKEWARLVHAAFDLASVGPSDQPVTRAYESPKGQPFDVRIVHSAARPALQAIDRSRDAGPEVQVLAAPVLTGQFEPHITATGLSLFASCPRKYYLGSYLGWDGDLLRRGSFARGSGQPRDASQIGTEVHAMLSCAIPPPQNPHWQSAPLAQVFEASALNKRLQKSAVKEHEWDFVFGLGELIVRGVVDVWFEEPSGIVVVDYKTNNVSASEALAAAEEYLIQLQIYALALEAATGKRVREAWIYFLQPDVPVAVPLGNRPQILALATEVIQAQEAVDFPARPGQHCTRCEFFGNLCPVKPRDLPPRRNEVS